MALFLALLPSLLITLALMLVERLRGRESGDWRCNLQVWWVNLAVMLVVLPLVPVWRGAALLDGARLPFWAGFAVFLIVKDLGEYLYHRAQHAVPLLWAMHSLHHSDPAMNTLTTQRHFWGDQLVKQATVWSAALMVITPTPAIVFAYGVVSLWNLLTHADLNINFGRWSWVINTPAYHRRHHSLLPEHYGSNFAALFPIFDVICGSYHRPQGRPPTGLAQRPETLGQVLVWPWLWNRAGRAARPGVAKVSLR